MPPFYLILFKMQPLLFDFCARSRAGKAYFSCEVIQAALQYPKGNFLGLAKAGGTGTGFLGHSAAFSIPRPWRADVGIGPYE